MNAKILATVLALSFLSVPLWAGGSACGSSGSSCSMKSASACPMKGGGCSTMMPAAPAVGMHQEGDVRLKAEVPTVSTAGLVALRNAGVAMTILDARSGKYDDGLRIPKARALAADADEKLIRRMLRNRKRLIVTYCASLSCPASAKLAERLKSLGYGNVIEYPYGIKGWKEMGLPTRQVAVGD